MTGLGERAARLYWSDGLTWNQVAERLKVKREKARGAARRWKANNSLDVSPNRPRIERDERDNTLGLTSFTNRIKTLDQLLTACEVDLDEWRVDRHSINKWEVSAKSGDGIAVEPLFQVKAWLTRRDPVPVFPVIQPITPSITYKPPRPAQTRKETRRSLVFCDPHFGFLKSLQDAKLTPFHDRRVLDLVLQIAVAAKVDRVDILGDVLDLPEWSDKFLRSPEFYWTTQPALLEAHWWLSQLRGTLPQAEITVHQGNHDKRLDIAIQKHLPAAYGLRSADDIEKPPALSVPGLLGLEGLAVKWVGDYPDDDDWHGGVRVGHGDVARKGNGDTAKAVVSTATETVIFGHVHRLEWATRTIWTRHGPQPVVAFCPGCTCRVDGIVPGRKRKQDWQQGLAIVDALGDYYSISPVLIEDGRAMWNGWFFEGYDRLDEIEKDLPGWNWKGAR